MGNTVRVRVPPTAPLPRASTGCVQARKARRGRRPRSAWAPWNRTTARVKPGTHRKRPRDSFRQSLLPREWLPGTRSSKLGADRGQCPGIASFGGSNPLASTNRPTGRSQNRASRRLVTIARASVAGRARGARPVANGKLEVRSLAGTGVSPRKEPTGIGSSGVTPRPGPGSPCGDRSVFLWYVCGYGYRWRRIGVPGPALRCPCRTRSRGVAQPG